MKRKFGITVIAVIVLSLIIPLCGAPAASAAAKPAQAKIPEVILLHKWDNTLYFDEVRIPSRATSVQMYLRTTGKYVKTVKKNTYQYKRYKKNTKKYILVKNKGKKTYKVYKAGKWKKIITTSKRNDVVYTKSLKASKVYQLKVRGKKGSKTGKFSKMLQFQTVSNKTMKAVRKDYGTEKDAADYDVLDLEAKKDDPPHYDGDEFIDPMEEYEKAVTLSKFVDYNYSKELFISKKILEIPQSDDGMTYPFDEGTGTII